MDLSRRMLREEQPVILRRPGCAFAILEEADSGRAHAMSSLRSEPSLAQLPVPATQSHNLAWAVIPKLTALIHSRGEKKLSGWELAQLTLRN